MLPTDWVSIGVGNDTVKLPFLRTGVGPQVLFLSGSEGMRRSRAWINDLARNFEVTVPIHPGFGGSPAVPHIRRPNDLALLYLSLLDKAGPTIVIGHSFGGWIAAEMAIKSCQNISQLILINSVGFKFGQATESEILDLYASSAADVMAAQYASLAHRVADLSDASNEHLTHLVEDRAAEAYYSWSPYFHSPGLHHWLYRIACPTLVLWGQHDGVVPISYGQKIADRIPGARFISVPKAAHHPHIENPHQILAQIQNFAGSN